MRRAAKLAFIHRRLWERDPTYRAAVLLGPPPLLGCAIAAALWTALHAVPRPTAPPPWAHLDHPATASEAPRAVEPTAPLPPAGPDGALAGLRPGWRIRIRPIEVSPTLDVTIAPTPVASLALDAPTIDMDRLLAAAAPNSRPFVGVATALLAIRTGGTYALAMRLDRAAGPPADCLVRLGTREPARLRRSRGQPGRRHTPPIRAGGIHPPTRPLRDRGRLRLLA